MRRHSMFFAVVMSVFVLVESSSGMAARAACMENQSGRTLYVIMKSKLGKFERMLPVGHQICQNVKKNETVKVSILPFGRARFGCQVEMAGDEKSAIWQFNTNGKCKFSPAP